MGLAIGRTAEMETFFPFCTDYEQWEGFSSLREQQGERWTHLRRASIAVALGLPELVRKPGSINTFCGLKNSFFSWGRNKSL